jgi:hypothetical protein
MYQDWRIDYSEEGYVNIHIQVAHIRFQNFGFLHYDHVQEVAFWVAVVPVLEEVHPSLCASIVSADSLLCHLGVESSCWYDFHKQLLCVIPSKPSPAHGKANQLPASSLLGHQLDVS